MFTFTNNLQKQIDPYSAASQMEKAANGAIFKMPVSKV